MRISRVWGKEAKGWDIERAKDGHQNCDKYTGQVYQVNESTEEIAAFKYHKSARHHAWILNQKYTRALYISINFFKKFNRVHFKQEIRMPG